ncbi:DNA gyrase inhibitor [Methylobacterium sp. Leaf102]|uniref:DNA gyrase inhibitor YacG n=1 Tax=Methylobacterium sp. Leaf102 TaxID=1736253 RepID=UPI0006FEDE78|nr:DNA gyrase inhibitor YacG [Methylobacterium sp. Leaf102]KQP28801.1 DNA gyrase inhibitor [Methylobacterium sp. Leaf102]
MTGPIPWPTAPEEACPICRKPAKPEFRPFCSTRCADVDLGRWLTDRYAIPTAEDEDEDAEPQAGRDRSE